MGDAADDLELREIADSLMLFCEHGLWEHECDDPACFGRDHRRSSLDGE